MNFMKQLIAPVLAALLTAGAANAAFWQWSRTSATNATADPSINWAEGMSPSSVNDSARAMMARLAEWRDDTSGFLVATGTSTAYAITTNEGMSTPTPSDGQFISFRTSLTNGIAPTLAVDGGTAYPIESSLGTAVASGTIIAGMPYSMMFRASTNVWLLRNFYGSPFTVPLGGVVIHTGDTSPNSNFAFANGACISRTTYAAYFALVGTRFSACDGVSTFGLPDLRERLVGFQGTMGGAASPGRITTAGGAVDGLTVGASGGAQNRTIAQANLPAVTLNTSIASGQGSHQHTVGNPGSLFLAQVGSGGIATLSGAANNISNAATDNLATLPAMSGTTPLGGSGTALPALPPMLILTALVRIN